MRKKQLWSKRILAFALSTVMVFSTVDSPSFTALASEVDEQATASETVGETQEPLAEESTLEVKTDDITTETSAETVEDKETAVLETVSEELSKNEIAETEESVELTKAEQTEEPEQTEPEQDAILTASDNIDSGTVNDISWVIDKDGKLTISGSGNYYESNGLGSNMPWGAPWYQHRDKITSAEVRVTGMTDMSYMFQDCTALTQVDLSGFSSDNLKRINGMFDGCERLTSIDLSMLQTENVIYMSGMFNNCSSLISVKFGAFQTENVTDMSSMFSGCASLADLDLSTFQTGNVTDMTSMFRNCKSLTSLDLSTFQTENVTDMQGMFSGCEQMAEVKLDRFNTSKVTNMNGMFSGCHALTRLDLSHFNTSKVTDMSTMFDGCNQLTVLNMGKFRTENVINMSSMFRDCKSLTELDLGSFDTTNVRFMSSMFDGCGKLANLTMGNFNTENATTMERIFTDCSSLTALDLSGFHTEKVTDMSLMFNGCSSLKSLDLNSFNTEKVTDMNEMFSGCGSLTTLDLSSFDMSGLKDETSLCFLCDALTTIYTPCNLSVTIELPINYAEDFKGENVSWYRDGNVITEFPKNLNHSIRITKGQTAAVTEAYITAAKQKTVYECKDVLNVDDLKVQYYGTDGTVKLITNYTTNQSKIDMSVPGTKELCITYKDGEKELTATVKLIVRAVEGNIAEGVSGNITWVIDQKGKLTVTGSGDYETSMGKAPWYDYRAQIKTAEMKATNMTNVSWMFAECINLTAVDVKEFDTENIVNMSWMFAYCNSLTELDLSSFHTQNTQDMSYMFNECTNLNKINLSGFYTTKVIDMSGMFAYCNSLTQLDLSSFDLSGMGGETEGTEILLLEHCDKLLYLDTPKNCSVIVQLPGYEDETKWYDKDGKEYQTIPNLSHSTKLYKNGYTGGDEKEEMTITYDMQGHGTQLAPTTVKSGEKLTVPAVPAVDGYTFGGWYKEASCINAWNFDTDTVTDNITLFAKWTKNVISAETDIDDSDYTLDQRTDLKTVGAVIAKIKTKVYDGDSYEPIVKVTVTENGKKKMLTEGTDYRVLYENNVKAGTDGKVTVKGNGIYKGTVTAPLTITPKSVKKLKIVTGSMTVGDKSAPTIYVYDGAKQLTEGTDYGIRYDKNLTMQPTNGAKVTVNGVNNYTGSTTAKVAVYEGEASQIINPAHVTLSAQKAPYTGKAIKTIIPQVKIGSMTLQPNKDYKVQYQNNKNAGIAYVIVTGKGAYKGKVVKYFEITSVTSDLMVKEIKEKTYNGKLQNPSVTVTANGKKLSKKDYTVIYAQNLHAETKTAKKAQVTVIGKGNYAGAQGHAEFMINPQKIAKASVKGAQGNLILTYNKRVLKEGTDYTLQYSEPVKNKTEVTITGKGDFTGIAKKKVAARANSGEEESRTQESSTEESKVEESRTQEGSTEESKTEEGDSEKEREISEKLAAVYEELDLDSLSPIEKIGAIYDYVTGHVSYDGTSETRYTLYGALIDGKAVCQGYALLMERMLNDNQLPTQYISGIGLSCSGGPARHAWNIVEYNGFYYNLDATWDCTNGKTREWFMKSQADFEDHVRDDKYETETYHASYPMAKYSYGEEGALPSYENLNSTFSVAGGGTVSTSAESGKKATVLIFGRTTCSNTMNFLKSFKEKEFCKDNSIKIIFGDVNKDEDESMVLAFQKEYGTEDMYFCYDTGSVINFAAFQYYNKKYSDGGSFTMPLVVVIDPQNKVRYIRNYPVSVANVEQCLERLEAE